MKAIVQTKKPETYIQPTNMEVIQAFRPSVITVTEFISTLVLRGKLKVLADNLPMTANDEDFFKCYVASDKKVELAVEAYASMVKADPEAEAKAAAETKAKADAALAAEAKAKTDAKAAAEAKAKTDAPKATGAK